MQRRTASSGGTDLSSFDDVLSDALKGFRSDPSYAIGMARSAVTIQNKRRVWTARAELKEAAAKARSACAADPDPFTCQVPGPCGTGTCPYASFELSRVDVDFIPGSMTRPRRSRYPLYDLENATKPWVALKEQMERGSREVELWKEGRQ